MAIGGGKVDANALERSSAFARKGRAKRSSEWRSVRNRQGRLYSVTRPRNGRGAETGAIGAGGRVSVLGGFL